jgi:hypothetical protein
VVPYQDISGTTNVEAQMFHVSTKKGLDRFYESESWLWQSRTPIQQEGERSGMTKLVNEPRYARVKSGRRREK